MIALAVDYDRTLVERDAPLRWRAGAKDGLLAVLRGGARVVIHSCRATPPEPRDADAEREAFYALGVLPEELADFWERFEAMRDFLRVEGILGLVEIWQAPGKPRVDRYVDDEAETPDWHRIAREFGVG